MKGTRLKSMKKYQEHLTTEEYTIDKIELKQH